MRHFDYPGTFDRKSAAAFGKTPGNDRAVTGEGGGPSESSTISPQEQSGVNDETGSK